MYAWLWHHIPGPTLVRVGVVALALAALFVLLMEVVYPAVESAMPYSDVAVDPAPAGPTAAAAPAAGPATSTAPPAG